MMFYSFLYKPKKYIKFGEGIMDSILVYLMKEYSAIVESSEIKQNREHKISFRMLFIK